MKKNKDGFAFPAYGSGNRAGADGSKVKEKRFRYSCHYNVRHPSQCDGQSGYGVTKLDAIVVSYRPLRCNSYGVQMYHIPIYNKIRCTVKA